MQIVNLYSYNMDNGMLVTPEKHNESDLPAYHRLIADAGKSLTNGSIRATCIDVDINGASEWSEESEDMTAEEALSLITGGEI